MAWVSGQVPPPLRCRGGRIRRIRHLRSAPLRISLDAKVSNADVHPHGGKEGLGASVQTRSAFSVPLALPPTPRLAGDVQGSVSWILVVGDSAYPVEGFDQVESGLEVRAELVVSGGEAAPVFARCRPRSTWLRRLTPGQAADTQQLIPLLEQVWVPRPGQVGRPRKRPDSVTGDKAYSSRANRKALRDKDHPGSGEDDVAADRPPSTPPPGCG